MSEKPKALHPVKVAGKIVPAGAEIDPAKVSPARLARMIEKGRVTPGAEAASVNRAETVSGREAAPPPSALKGKGA